MIDFAVASARAIHQELVTRHALRPQVIFDIFGFGAACGARRLTEGEETSRLCGE
jgi:hypothetical protein